MPSYSERNPTTSLSIKIDTRKAKITTQAVKTSPLSTTEPLLLHNICKIFEKAFS